MHACVYAYYSLISMTAITTEALATNHRNDRAAQPTKIIQKKKNQQRNSFFFVVVRTNKYDKLLRIKIYKKKIRIHVQNRYTCVDVIVQ